MLLRLNEIKSRTDALIIKRRDIKDMQIEDRPCGDTARRQPSQAKERDLSRN